MFSNEPLVITSTIYLFLSQLTCSWKVRHFLFIGNDHKETSPVSMQSILLVFQSFQSINHQQPHVQFKGTAHATLDKFENGVFTLKTHQTGFPSTPRRRNLKNNHRLLRICVWQKLGQGDHMLVVMSSFSKSSVFKMVSVHTSLSAKPAFSKSSCLKSVFETFRFREGLVWTVGLTVEIKLRFQISPA